jgi:hypothetical protein
MKELRFRNMDPYLIERIEEISKMRQEPTTTKAIRAAIIEYPIIKRGIANERKQKELLLEKLKQAEDIISNFGILIKKLNDYVPKIADPNLAP